jgi:hypothetical protein
MSTFNKISTRISEQLPDFVLEEGPKLEAFLRAYYEWMELSGNAIDGSKNLLSYQDIDTTLDQYLQYFKEEIFQNIPDNTIVDKKLLAKHITDLYRSKGSEKSFKFLFRALYNEDIDIYYPGDYVLRTSDGRWQQDTVIRVTGLTLQEAETLAGQLITGQTSGAYGRVESIAETVEFDILVIELVLSNIIGTFIDTETVLSDGSNLSATIYSSTGSLQNIILQRDFRNLPRGSGGGVFHRSGDLITFTSDAGSGANGVIISTDDRSAINVGITFGGSGYVNNLPVIITGSSGYGAVAKVTGIGPVEVPSFNLDIIYPMRNVPLNEEPTFVSTGANTAAVSANLAGANIYSSLISGLLFSNNRSLEVLSICSDTIYSMRNVPLNVGLTFISTGANTAAVSANLAGANIYSSLISGLLFSNVTTGTITQITTTNYGLNYQRLPIGTVFNTNVANEDIPDGIGGFKGKNAVLDINNLPGTIKAVRINDKGSAYSKNENIGIVNQSRGGTINAIGTPIVTGIETKAGYYTSTKGFLSWDQRLQDSTFWQDFSYVIRSEQFVDKYRNVVKNLVHPSGTKLFGETILVLPFDAYAGFTTDIERDSSVIIFSTLNTSNSSNVESVVFPPLNLTTGLLFIFNYTTLDPFLQPTVGTGVPTTLENFSEIAIGDLNSAKLVFGNNTTFNSNPGSLDAAGRPLFLPISFDTMYPMRNVPLNTGPTFVSTGANTAAVSANLAGANIYSSLISGLLFSNVTTAITGYMRQSVTSSNTLIGNGGTNFTQLQVGDTIYSTNSVGSISRFVRVVSVADASSIVTSPSINSTAEYFQYTSTSTTGARIKLAPPLLESQDVIIFDTYGGSPDGQYAVNVVASTINTVFTISSQYMGSTLSNGTFTYIDN